MCVCVCFACAFCRGVLLIEWMGLGRCMDFGYGLFLCSEKSGIGTF